MYDHILTWIQVQISYIYIYIHLIMCCLVLIPTYIYIHIWLCHLINCNTSSYYLLSFFSWGFRLCMHKLKLFWKIQSQFIMYICDFRLVQLFDLYPRFLNMWCLSMRCSVLYLDHIYIHVFESCPNNSLALLLGFMYIWCLSYPCYSSVLY